MTFNIRYGAANDGTNSWPHRRKVVLQTIRDFGPDLLGMQEVLAFQAEYLRGGLKSYGFHGVGREDGKEAGEFAPVMWRKDRFDLAGAGDFWLSETPGVPGSKSWDSSLPRLVSWVVLRDKAAGNRVVMFFNTHFDHRGAQARLESAKLLRSRVGMSQPSWSVIVTGDFNTTEDDPPYAVLVKGQTQIRGRELVDVFRAVHPERGEEEATFNGWRPVTRGRRIDWILCSTNLEPVEARINRSRPGGRLPSDHYPVEAVLRYR